MALCLVRIEKIQSLDQFVDLQYFISSFPNKNQKNLG